MVGGSQPSTELHTLPRKRTKVDSTESTENTHESRTIENDDVNDAEEEDQDMLPLDQMDDGADQDEDEDEDDEDVEMNTESAPTQSKAHTSDRVRKVDTDPEVEAAFRERYMAQITQAFGDELNALRETDELDGSHLELLIDSLHQTGHVFLPSEKELVALPSTSGCEMEQQQDEQQPLLGHSSQDVQSYTSLPGPHSPLTKPLLYEPPPTTSRHWLVLSMACLLLAGNYYCYDLPAAMNLQIQEWLGTDDTTHQYQLNLLYSAYSLPNIVLPLAGGFLVDRLSASKMLLVFNLWICLGQALFVLGLGLRSFPTMVMGRFLFGVGGECLEVAQCKITTDWFKHAWLGLALGLNLSSARISTALNDNLSPWIENRLHHHPAGGVVAASSVGLFICLTSFACGLGLAYLDRPASRTLAGVKVDGPKNVDRLSGEEGYLERQALLWEDQGGRGGEGEEGILDLEENNEDDDDGDDEKTATMMAEDDKMFVAEIWTLQPKFWILCLCCITLYGAVSPFFHVLSDFLQQRWYHGDPQRAGTVMSLPDVISAVGSPLCGFLVDRFGHRSRYIPLSAILLIWAHVQLGFTNATPIIGMTVIGLAYSLFASVLWPCIPFLVEDEQLGTAYGIVTIALNISLTIFPIAVAWLLQRTNGDYGAVQVLFITLAVLGLFLSILLNVLDERDTTTIGLLLEEEGEEDEAISTGEREETPGSPVPASVQDLYLKPPPPLGATTTTTPAIHPLQQGLPEGRSLLPSEFDAHLRRRSSIEEQMIQQQLLEQQRQQQHTRRRIRRRSLAWPRLSDDHGRVTSLDHEYQGRITTRSVGCDGIVAIIPHHSQRQHPRRHSTATDYVSQLERARQPSLRQRPPQLQSQLQPQYQQYQQLQQQQPPYDVQQQQQQRQSWSGWARSRVRGESAPVTTGLGQPPLDHLDPQQPQLSQQQPRHPFDVDSNDPQGTGGPGGGSGADESRAGAPQGPSTRTLPPIPPSPPSPNTLT
ncbi:hypothetical protein DFQ26_002728 [Actinomortierella ambigua]|nr:hypothetical protein DFQ26_002728 [Actinomortierella ambigua]